MDITADVLVVGGGMAGLVAGSVAAELGQDVVLLRKGQSATAMSSGAIDLIGYMPDGRIPITSPIDGLHALSALYVLHPYSILGFIEDDPTKMPETIIARITEIIEWIKTNLADSVAPLIGDLTANLYPITPLGTTKPTCLIQETMYSGDLNESTDNSLLFAGIRGNPDFDAASAARVYLESRASSGTPPNKVSHCIIDIAPFGKPYNVSSIEIARHLDHPDSIDMFAKQLKKHIDLFEVTHVAIPPILGLKRARANKAALESELGVSVFELLAFPPSVPGLRLQMALENLFTSKGGKMMTGFEALASKIENREVKNVTAIGPRRNVRISAKSVVLASGKYVGGGLYATESGLKETVFDLMTVSENFYSAHEMRPPHHTSIQSVSSDGHEVFGAGIGVDPQYRPVDRSDEAAAENLFAAGSVIAGYNYATEKSGLGVALVTGHSAGYNAALKAKEVS